MPVRSLGSSVLRWPSREEVEEALKAWLSRHPIPGLVAAGYFGSYARGEAGVGSDLDLLLLVAHSPLPPWKRPLELPLEELPVPAAATAVEQRCDPVSTTAGVSARNSAGSPPR